MPKASLINFITIVFLVVIGATYFISYNVDLTPYSTIDAGDFADTEQFQRVPR